MALFLDRHKAPGATAADIAAAHELDLSVQERYKVRYVTYWFDADEGTVFCLAEGPDRQSLETVHREAHGLVADNIIEVGDGPINAFLGEIPRHPAGEPYVDSAVRVILFTDLCDSTQQTQELGDEEFMLLIREHDEIVRTALKDQHGREVKHTGDGIMASFTSVSAAVASAIEIQRSLRNRNATCRAAHSPPCWHQRRGASYRTRGLVRGGGSTVGTSVWSGLSWWHRRFDSRT